jgi:hypothetical protein
MRTELEELWFNTVYVWGRTVDPNDEYHWTSLKLGWALGKGMSIADATKFAYEGVS